MIKKIFKATLLAFSFCIDILFAFFVFVAYQVSGNATLFSGLAGIFCIILFPLFLISVFYKFYYFRKSSKKNKPPR